MCSWVLGDGGWWKRSLVFPRSPAGLFLLWGVAGLITLPVWNFRFNPVLSLVFCPKKKLSRLWILQHFCGWSVAFYKIAMVTWLFRIQWPQPFPLFGGLGWGWFFGTFSTPFLPGVDTSLPCWSVWDVCVHIHSAWLVGSSRSHARICQSRSVPWSDCWMLIFGSNSVKSCWVNPGGFSSDDQREFNKGN